MKSSPKEFASLLTVGNATVRSSAPVIPAEHSARLIALGYMVYLEGRLRMTTELLGPLFGFFIVGGEDRDTVCYVAIVSGEVGIVIGLW